METVPDTFSGLFYGYSVIWLLIAAYLVSLGCRVKRIEKRFNQPEE